MLLFQMSYKVGIRFGGWGGGWAGIQSQYQTIEIHQINNSVVEKALWGFPGGAVVKNPPANARVRALVWEGSTCLRATKPVCHNYWPRVPQLLSPRAWSPCSTTREATAIRSPCTATKSSSHSPQLEKARA